jgi:DNA-binding NarL/FixJ family response regulator
VVAPTVTRRLLDPATGRAPADERVERLTVREREVLARGLSNGEVAAELPSRRPRSRPTSAGC